MKIGILGAGKIAHSTVPAMIALDEIECYAVASRDYEKARDFADRYGFQKAYGSYEQMLSDPELELVYIATPHSHHYEHMMLCMEHGKAVLCEKPVSENTEQLKEIIALAKEKNTFFMEAMCMKCNPVYRKAVEWVNSGKTGTVKAVKADFCSMCGYDENDRLFRKDCGGGALLDLGVYVLSFACSFLGYNPEEIISNAMFGKSDVDMFNSIFLRYKDGSHVALTTAFSMPCENGAAIFGEKGTIVFDRWFFCTDKVTLYDENNRLAEEVKIEKTVNGYEYEVAEVNKCLRENLAESSLVPHSETIAIMNIMDKCRKDWGFVYPDEK